MTANVVLIASLLCALFVVVFGHREQLVTTGTLPDSKKIKDKTLQPSTEL